MTFGISLYRADGSVLVSSDSFGTVYVDLLTVAPGATLTKSYPAFIGRTFKTLSGSKAALSYPASVPTVYVDGVDFEKTEKIYIFCL